jgi:hypothetical protein
MPDSWPLKDKDLKIGILGMTEGMVILTLGARFSMDIAKSIWIRARILG